MKGAKPYIQIVRDSLADVPPPAWLSPMAKEVWIDTVSDLSGRKILTRDNLPSVANYCIALGQVREAEEEVQRMGLLIKVYAITKDGEAVVTGVKKNPALQVQKDAMNTARLIGAELGTTPISRSRPTLANSDDTDDLFDF